MDREQAWSHLEQSLTRLLVAVSPQLDDKDREFLTEFIANREFGVALEWLHLLSSKTLELSEPQRVEVRRLADFMEIDLSKLT